jgi:AhpD family alkylhydroperoxidase
MSRVELLDSSTAPLTVRPYFADGDPGPIVAALANVPEMVAPTLGFIGAALGAGSTGLRPKEFAILRTSALQSCQYCVGAHTTVALDVGLLPDEVRALRGEIAIEEAFSDDADLALIAWIDANAGATGPISDDVYERVRRHFAEHTLVELSITIGATLFLNRFATGFELPTSPDVTTRLASEGFS